MIVDTYILYAPTGRKIRKATRVTFPDGYIVRFLELLPKRLAIPEAIKERQRHET